MPLSSLLLRWYRRHGRRLPWRGHPDPYAVWVSEIMLQQTRVEAVIPYFERWMARFPSVRALAEASEQEVLILWEGLGYYSRARSLHKAARIVADELGGQLPRSAEALRELPGIGRYTASAIASIAFGLDEAALDGNVRRVLARVFDVDLPADSAEGEKRLRQIAAENLPKGRAGEFNQALMDLGAMICLPKNPRCEACPLKTQCRARSLGVQERRPVLRPKSTIPHRIFAAAVIAGRTGNPPRAAVLLAKRPSRGLLGGLWEFPNGEIRGGSAETLPKTLPKTLKESYGLDVHMLPSSERTTIQHAYTHFRVTVHVLRGELAAVPQSETLKWVKLAELETYPMGKVDRLIARKLLEARKDKR